MEPARGSNLSRGRVILLDLESGAVNCRTNPVVQPNHQPGHEHDTNRAGDRQTPRRHIR